jgi:cytochrome c-type biogenesis protein CcmH
MSRRHRLLSPTGLVWVTLAVVLAIALAFSVARSNATPTLSQRAAAIDGNLKCPSCEAISVEDSSASTAAAVRQLVLSRLREGQTDQQIYQYLESRYGPSILLRPPTTGLTAVVWVVPLVAAAAGLGGLGVFFWRRRRPVAVVVSPQDRALVDQALVDRATVDRESDVTALSMRRGP